MKVFVFENETVLWREELNRLMSEIIMGYKTGFSASQWAGRMTSPIFSTLWYFSCMFWILWFMALITGEINALVTLSPPCCSVLWTQMDTSTACVCARVQGLQPHLPLWALRLGAAQSRRRVRVLSCKILRADKHLPCHSLVPSHPSPRCEDTICQHSEALDTISSCNVMSQTRKWYDTNLSREPLQQRNFGMKWRNSSR